MQSSETEVALTFAIERSTQRCGFFRPLRFARLPGGEVDAEFAARLRDRMPARKGRCGPRHERHQR